MNELTLEPILERLADMVADRLLKKMPLGTSESDEYLDVDGLMEYLGIGKSMAYTFMRRADFPSFQVGTHYRVSKNAVDKWIAESGIKNGQAIP